MYEVDTFPPCGFVGVPQVPGRPWAWQLRRAGGRELHQGEARYGCRPSPLNVVFFLSVLFLDMGFSIYNAYETMDIKNIIYWGESRLRTLWHILLFWGATGL